VKGLALSILMLAVCSHAHAETSPLPGALKCEFESYASAVAEKNATSITAQIKSQPGIEPLTFADLDANTQSAQMIGNVGASRVTMFATGTTWSFVEVTDAGNINTTQVFLWDEPEADRGVYRAIHSRHSSIMGVIVASQHYGHCKVLN
jgi:hypothetical protein